MKYAFGAIVFFVLILLYLFLREFFCWYFKINERIALTEELIFEIKNIRKEKNQENEDEKKKLWIKERIHTLVQEGLPINDAKIKAINEYTLKK